MYTSPISATVFKFPISRDPPEGGTCIRCLPSRIGSGLLFPISRDPPEGGTIQL